MSCAGRVLTLYFLKVKTYQNASLISPVNIPKILFQTMVFKKLSSIGIHPIFFHSRYHGKFRFEKILLPTLRLGAWHFRSHNICLCNLLNSSALIWCLYWWSKHSYVPSVICFSVGFRPILSSARTITDTAGPTVSSHAAEGCTAQRPSYESKDNWRTSYATLPDKWTIYTRTVYAE